MNLRIAAALLVLSVAGAARADELTARVEALTKKYEATVGVAAIDTVTGRELAVRADERFPMGSVYKLPIAMALLRKSSLNQLSLDGDVTIDPKDFSPGYSPLAEDAGGKPVTEPIGMYVVQALRDSDNTASDVILGLAGGPEGVMAYLKFLGVLNMDVSRSEKQIAADLKKQGEAAYWKDQRDTTTPHAMALLIRMFDEKAHGLNTGSQQFVHDMLLHTTTGAALIRAGIPAGNVILEKDGTMPGVVNDAAIITTPDERHRVVLAIFSKGWKKTPEAERDKLVAEIATMIYDEFTKY